MIFNLRQLQLVSPRVQLFINIIISIEEKIEKIMKFSLMLLMKLILKRLRAESGSTALLKTNSFLRYENLRSTLVGGGGVCCV